MRTKKAFKNIMASMSYQVISIICGLITPRLLLLAFGSTYNGVVVSATQFLSMITILNVGIAGATRVALYKTLAVNDVLGTSRIVKANKLYMRKVALCVVVFAGILCVAYPLFSHNSLPAAENAALIAIVSISTFAEYFFGLTNSTLLSADQSGYIEYSFRILSTVLNTLLVALLIKLGCNVFLVKLASSIVFLITPAAMNFYVKKKYRLIDDCEPDNSAIENRGAVAFHSVANIIHNNTDLVILTLFTDAAVISVYSVYYLVVGKIRTLMSVFTNGLEAAFGNMWVKKEHERLQKNFRVLEYGLFSFTIVVFSCVGVLLIPFVRQYTSGVHDVNYIVTSLAILVTVTEAMYCVREPYLILVQATGNYEATKRGALIEAALNMGISLALVIPFGMNGVMFGTLVANTFRTVQYALFISNRILQRSLSEIVRRVIWSLLNAGLIIGLGGIVRDLVTWQEGWMGWICMALVMFGTALAVTAASSVIFYRNDFLSLFGVLQRMLRRKAKKV